VLAATPENPSTSDIAVHRDSLSIGTVTAVKKANSADLGQAEPMLSDVAKANLRELANLPQA
jgi:hypothetical protein